MKFMIRDKMQFSFDRTGWHFLFRYHRGDVRPLGFVIKPVKHKLFSERYGPPGYYPWSFELFGLYFRTYRKELP